MAVARRALQLAVAHVDRVDPRIELVSAAFRIARAPEYSVPAVTPYENALDRLLAPLAAHPIVDAIQQLRNTHGISYDAPISLAVNLDLDSGHVDTTPLDRRWHDAPIDAFVAQLRAFAVASDLAGFLVSRSIDVAAAEERIACELGIHDLLGWATRFFGQRPPETAFVPGLALGTMSYQVRSGAVAYEVIGRASLDLPLAAIAMHELAHAVANPAVDRELARFIAPAEKLLAQRGAHGAYRTARDLVCETWVRAATLVFLGDIGLPRVARILARDDAAAGMPWTSELAKRFCRAWRPALDGQALIVEELLADSVRTYCQSCSSATIASVE